jgi:hypothetical protein
MRMNPRTRESEFTNIKPIKLNAGNKNPIELNNFLAVPFESRPLRIRLSLITPATIIVNQQVKKGIEDNSPFLKLDN